MSLLLGGSSCYLGCLNLNLFSNNLLCGSGGNLRLNRNSGGHLGGHLLHGCLILLYLLLKWHGLLGIERDCSVLGCKIGLRLGKDLTGRLRGRLHLGSHRRKIMFNCGVDILASRLVLGQCGPLLGVLGEETRLIDGLLHWLVSYLVLARLLGYLGCLWVKLCGHH